MKKRYAFIILALLVFAIGTACGTDAAMMRNDDVVDDAYIFEYKQFTPSEEIVEGNETALNTIKKLYDKDNLNVMADFSITFDMSSNPVYGSNHSEADYYLHYKVSDYPAEYDILFLFKDDTEVVRGTNDKSCIYLNDDDKERVDKNFAVEVATLQIGKGGAYLLHLADGGHRANLVVNEFCDVHGNVAAVALGPTVLPQITSHFGYLLYLAAQGVAAFQNTFHCAFLVLFDLFLMQK